MGSFEFRTAPRQHIAAIRLRSSKVEIGAAKLRTAKLRTEVCIPVS